MIKENLRVKILGFLGSIGFFLLANSAHAATLTYRHGHHLFTIDSALQKDWRSGTERWTWNGVTVEPDAAWRVDGDDVPALPPGVRREQAAGWNPGAIEKTLERLIGAPLRRPAGNVVIKRDEKGAVIFDGVGMTGRDVDLPLAAKMTIAALNQGVLDIELPVIETQPVIRVDDPELANMGITEVVTIGESAFGGSPVNRRHNIAVGLAKFNGRLIPQGATFSFNEVLGRVDASTGYRLELVIKGDRTEPDYGGGLCQISTTAYRGIWEYGFPITKRKNHSYTVRYYSPPGTDATVYPGAVDMAFTNDLPSALLMQTHQEKDNAYFIYYGTRDDRKAEIVGPYIYGRTTTPPDRTEYTTDLPPGERQKLGERVPGQKTAWYRIVQKADAVPSIEGVFSTYEARPLFYAVGVASLPEESALTPLPPEPPAF